MGPPPPPAPPTLAGPLIWFLNVSLHRPLSFMVEEETGTLATTTAKTALNIKKGFFSSFVAFISTHLKSQM